MRGSSMLWRALETARGRNLAEAGEAPAVPGSPGATRRALLKAFAATGVAAALPRPAEAFTGGRVAIIGGGIAGLSALHYLTEAGVDAQLYEARGRTGGRMFTRRPPDGSPAFEEGGQLVNTDHKDMHALLTKFGVGLVDRKREPHRTLILADGTPLSDEMLAEALRPIAAQIGKDADLLDKDFARHAPALDRMSIAAYLDRHAGLLKEPWARQLMEATSRTEYGVEPREASAIELIFNLPTVDGTRVEVLGGSDERFVIEGGSSALIDALTAQHRGRITTGKRLWRVERQGRGMKLTFLDDSVVEADRVILAVPAPLLRTIGIRVPIPALWHAYIAEVALGRNEKIQSVASATPWRGPMGMGGELWDTARDGYSLGWEGSVHLGQRADPVWTFFLGGDQVDREGDPGAIARAFAATVERGIPGLGGAIASGPYRRTAWHRDALTLGAYVNYAPGQLSRFAGLLSVDSDDPAERQVSSAGRILFAGEHLSDAWPGYMNGGAETGRMAAEALTGKRLARRAA